MVYDSPQTTMIAERPRGRNPVWEAALAAVFSQCCASVPVQDIGVGWTAEDYPEHGEMEWRPTWQVACAAEAVDVALERLAAAGVTVPEACSGSIPLGWSLDVALPDEMWTVIGFHREGYVALTDTVVDPFAVMVHEVTHGMLWCMGDPDGWSRDHAGPLVWQHEDMVVELAEQTPDADCGTRLEAW